jgi:hypothetical protein
VYRLKMEPWRAVDAHKWRREGSIRSRGRSVDQWLQIRITLIVEHDPDRHYSENSDPDPYESEKRDPDRHESDADPHPPPPPCLSRESYTAAKI